MGVAKQCHVHLQTGEPAFSTLNMKMYGKETCELKVLIF